MQYLLALTILLIPTYTIRFGAFGLHLNLLMLWIIALWLIFAGFLFWKGLWNKFLFSFKRIPALMLGLILAFFLSGIVSFFINGHSNVKLGQFIVLFLQPISLFFISHFILEQTPKAKNLLLNAIYLLLAIAGAYAFFQYFTLIGLPKIYWGNSIEPKRATSFFSHPNFYSLFSAPLLALLIPDAIANFKLKILNFKSIFWIIGATGLLLSMSRAGWLGLLVATIVYLIVAADKRTRLAFLGLAIIATISVFSIANLRYRIILPFLGEKSSISRISLWETGWKGIKESPILGMGLTGFSQNWKKLNTDPNLDTHNFPHNIFLNFWVETGLLGLISFIIIIAIFIYHGLRHPVIPDAKKGNPKSSSWAMNQIQDDKIIKFGIALFLIALLTQGLIDNPYFKNDLAMVFWLVLSMGL